MKHLETFLKERLEETAMAVTGASGQPIDAQAERLLEYLSWLSAWSERVDLVAGATPEELIRRHLCDAYACWLLLGSESFFVGHGTYDVGSGGGLPGLLFALFSPDEPVVLCEPREQRVIFLKEARRRLKLPHVKIVQKRIEDFTDADAPKASLVVMRALRPEGGIYRASMARLRPGGSLAFLSGGETPPPLELQSARKLTYFLPGDSAGRAIYLEKSNE